MTQFLIGIGIALLTFAGVEIFRRWSLRRNLLDLPNERSSHTQPTPRGGGLIIALVCLTAYVSAAVITSRCINWSYVAGASLIAAISWLDDVYGINFVWRFAVHAAAAVLAIVGIGFFTAADLPAFLNVNGGFVGAAITFGGIVWLTNAYNFMDGIDGIAGTQALTAGLGWIIVGWTVGAPMAGIYGGIIAVSALGFLPLNWQPSKIFMGDVGSAFLGYTFAVIPLLAADSGELSKQDRMILLPTTIILLWLFIFDTLWTLAGRIGRREKIWQAHRGHIYQKMVILGYTHQTVTLVFGILSALNACAAWLLASRRVAGGWIIIWLAIQSIGLLGWRRINTQNR